MRPVVLSIAGSDCSGGAGIQADLRAIEAGGGFAATALTAVTAQNGAGVAATTVLGPAIVERQLEAVFADLPVAAVKSGMLGGAAPLRAVARALRRHRPRHYVLDPVLCAGSGTRLLPRSCLGLLRDELFPLATLLTPNVPEAEALSGVEIRTLEDAERAARTLLGFGARAVLITGGHLAAHPATDLLVTPRRVRVFAGPYLPGRDPRGTGCIHSASIATRLALGAPLEEAVAEAKRLVTEAIRHALPSRSGRGPADPLHRLHAAAPPERARLGAREQRR